MNELLKEKGITKYALAKQSGLPHTTVIDICSGKAKIEKCSGETLYKIAKTLNVQIENLLREAMHSHSEASNDEHRPSFEVFKSNVCHMVKDNGDTDFLISILRSDEIIALWGKKWFPESLYLLAMVDYLCRINDLPLCDEYESMRQARLSKTLYPTGIVTLCAALNSDKPKEESLAQAIPEFLRFNIVENEVRNVC